MSDPNHLPPPYAIELSGPDQLLFISGDQVYYLDHVDPDQMPSRDRAVARALALHAYERLAAARATTPQEDT